MTSASKGRSSLAATLTLGLLHAASAGADDCHPMLDPSKPQYIVGYGSLMESGSKHMTEPDAGTNLPVMVTGFQRAWNTHGVYPTTYLGVRPSKSARMAASELQPRVADPGIDFVAECVRTTDGWSKHWVNDRLLPRRPYIHQPRAWEIDKRLKSLLPELAEAIQIE